MGVGDETVFKNLDLETSHVCKFVYTMAEKSCFNHNLWGQDETKIDVLALDA